MDIDPSNEITLLVSVCRLDDERITFIPKVVAEDSEEDMGAISEINHYSICIKGRAVDSMEADRMEDKSLITGLVWISLISRDASCGDENDPPRLGYYTQDRPGGLICISIGLPHDQLSFLVGRLDAVT